MTSITAAGHLRKATAFAVSILLVSIPGFAAVKFLVILGAALYGFIARKSSSRGLIVAFSALLSLLVAYAVATYTAVEAADRNSHIIRLLSFYAVFAAMTAISHGIDSKAGLDRICFWSVALMALFKIGIVISVLAFGIPLESALSAFGFESVTATIGESLFRLQFPSDFAVLFLISCFVGQKSRFTDAAFLCLALVVIFLSFSRFIFLCFFVGIAIRAIWIRRVDFLSFMSGLLMVATLLAFSDALIDRFTGEGSVDSDDVRIEQIQKLEEQITLRPWLGTGAGASVPSFLRSETIPYSYEVQWHATVMQLGFVGTAILVVNVAISSFWGIRRKYSIVCISMLITMWILAGFTNPFITSLGSAVGMSIARRRAQLDEKR